MAVVMFLSKVASVLLVIISTISADGITNGMFTIFYKFMFRYM